METYKKGGRIVGETREEKIAKIMPYNEARTEKMELWRAMAAGDIRQTKYTQEYLGELLVKAGEYIEECKSVGRPLTQAGFQKALGVKTDAWKKMRDGKYDYRLFQWLEFNDIPFDVIDECDVYEFNGKEVPLLKYSEFVNLCALEQQELLEEQCITSKTPNGCIFLLKALHSFDDQSGVRVTNQTLNVFDDKKLGTMDEIETARRLLK